MPPTQTSGPLNITLGTFPDDSDGLSLLPDIDIIRPAILFGDHVTIYSPHIQMMKHIASLGGLSDNELFLQIDAFIENHDPTIEENLIHVLARLADEVRNKPDLSDFERFAVELTTLHRQANARAYRDDVRPLNERMLKRIGYPQIRRAEELGLLTIAEVSPDEVMVQANRELIMTEDYLNHLVKFFQTPKSYPLIDGNSVELIQAALNVSLMSREVLDHSHGKMVYLANELISQVPTFQGCDLYKIIDVRKELKDPLVRFRRSVLRLAEAIEAPLYADEFEAAVHDIIVNDIEPSVLYIRESIELNRPLRRMVRKAATDAVVTSGVLSIGTAAFQQIPQIAGLAALPPAFVATGGGIAAIRSLASEWFSQSDRAGEIRRDDMYFLVALNDLAAPKKSLLRGGLSWPKKGAAS